MWVELSLILITLVFLYQQIMGRVRANYWESKGIPFLDKGTTWMDILTFKKTIFDQSYYKEAGKKCAKYAGVWEQGQHSLFITDPELIKHVFIKDFDSFVDRRAISSADPMVSNMLVALHGQQWKDVRNFLSPTFTSGKIRRMFDHFNGSGKRLEEHVRKIPEKMEGGGHIVTIPEVARRFTVDVIGATVFGIQTHALSDPKSIFYRLATRAANPSKLQMAKLLMFVFAKKLTEILKMQPFDAEVVNYFKGILSNALKQRRESNERRDDFLQLMVEARQGKLEGDTENEAKDEKEEQHKGTMIMSDDMIMAQCFLFFFAGFDTVANLITVCTYLLAANPKIQDKVRANVQTAIEATGGQITYDSASQMHYLDMFISETQRMYQSPPRLERQCTRDYKLPNSDFVVPKGMVVMTDPEAIHLDPQYFPNPQEFDPERFSSGNKGLRSPYVYLPFGLGPRNCIGMRFGLTEAKVAIAHLVHRFQILPAPTTPIPVKMDRVFTVIRAPKDLQVCLKFRE